MVYQERTTKIAQTLYIRWVSNELNYFNFMRLTGEERRLLFKSAAAVALEAAEEFSNVLNIQGD